MCGTEVCENSFDLDRAALVELDAGGLEPEPGDVGTATGREHHLVDDDVLMVGQHDAKTVIDLLDAFDDRFGDDPDAAPFHFGAQMISHVVVETAQDVVAAIDQRDLASRAR